MKSTRWFLVLAVAILSGLGAGYTALRYLSERTAQITPSAAGRSETRSVVLASRDLPLGKVLEESDVFVVEWPGGAVPEGYASSVSEVVGRSLVGEIKTNEAILVTKLADRGLLGMIPLIPEGMRAISVRSDEIVGVAGFVTPQTRVDVILIMTPPGGREPTSKIILQNLPALASGQEISETPDGRPVTVTVVTLLVNPEEAEKIALAESEGQIRMALRNTLDVESVETSGETASRLFTGVRAGSSGARPVVRTGQTTPEPALIELYRGVSKSTIRY